jgi:acyl-CoA thioesterase
VSYPRSADLDLIAFDGESFELTVGLSRHDGALYGGTGIAAAVMAMEAATQRGAIWVATQFVAQAHVGERIRCDVRTMAVGGRIAQLQVNGMVEDRVIFCAVGATAHPRPGGLTGQFVDMPQVSAPDDSPPFGMGPPGMAEFRERAFSRNLEFRQPTVEAPRRGHTAIWARLSSGAALTPAGLAYVADMVPVAIATASGKRGGGFSLDNAMRFTDPADPTEWVLLDLCGEAAAHGYGHGSLTAWSTSGTVLATGSQTASMAYMFDEGDDRSLQLLREGSR